MATHSINQKVERKIMECIDYTYTLEHNGTVLGMGGFRMITPTTAWCWVDLSDEAVAKLLTSYRVIREWIKTFVEKQEIKRLQAFVRDDENNIRLVKHLGFEKESVMKNFFGDEDGFMFARVF
jgi:hypothetical protein